MSDHAKSELQKTHEFSFLKHLSEQLQEEYPEKKMCKFVIAGSYPLVLLKKQFLCEKDVFNPNDVDTFLSCKGVEDGLSLRPLVDIERFSEENPNVCVTKAMWKRQCCQEHQTMNQLTEDIYGLLQVDICELDEERSAVKETHIQIILCRHKPFEVPLTETVFIQNVFNSFDMKVVHVSLVVKPEENIVDFCLDEEDLIDIKRGSIDYYVKQCIKSDVMFARIAKHVERGFEVNRIIFPDGCINVNSININEDMDVE